MRHGLGLGVGFMDRIMPSSYVYPLDLWGTDCLYAFSFRLLRSDYLGDSCRVRRINDNAETDIGFVNNYLDITTLETFVGNNTWTFAKWYDQMNSFDKAQPTAVEQPLGGAAGTRTTVNGFQVMNNQANDKGLYNTFTGGGASSMSFNVFYADGEILPATYSHSSPLAFYGVGQDNDASSPTANAGTPSYYKNGVLLAPTTRNTLFDAFQLQLGLMSTVGVDISAWTESSSLFPSYRGICGYNLEEIVYSSQTASRTDIEANILNYYGI